MLSTRMGIEKLIEDLRTVALQRYKTHRAEFQEANIDDVLDSISALGNAALDMHDKGIDLGVVCRAMLYFANGVNHVVKLQDIKHDGEEENDR